LSLKQIEQQLTGKEYAVSESFGLLAIRLNFGWSFANLK
jgi:hypothetical protein